MNCIEQMVDEHRNIKRMLSVMRGYCFKILKDEEIQYRDFFKMVEFVRNYADKHHHGKEEALLFEYMVKELGTTAEKLVRHGMLVEHDMGRLYIQELEGAVKRVLSGDDEARLDVIANAVSYTHLLHRHIDKEDAVVFKYAQNNLSSEALKKLDAACDELEKSAHEEHVQAKYIALVSELEAKVSV